MNKVSFKVYLEYDPEYRGFVADVPTLPGCMSQGKTEDEALENIREAIRGYITAIKKHQQTVPSEEVKYITVGV